MVSMHDLTRHDVAMLRLAARNIGELTVEHDDLKLALGYKRLQIRIQEIALEVEQLTRRDDERMAAIRKTGSAV